MSFGKMFKKLRQEKGLTQEELREQFNQKYHYNYTAAAISMYENDKRLPEIEALKDFANFFDVSIDYLLNNSNDNYLNDKRVPMKRLKKLRLEKDFTLEELGKLIHIQKSTVSKYERGEAQPSQEVLIKLAEVLDTSTDYLLELTDDQRPVKEIIGKNDSERALTPEEESFVDELFEILKADPEFANSVIFDKERQEDYLEYLKVTNKYFQEMADKILGRHKKDSD